MGKLICCITLLLFFAAAGTSAQQTNSRAMGRILSDSGQPLGGATLRLIHQPTQETWNYTSDAGGYFHFFNLKPGGPYTLQVSHSGYQALEEPDLFTQFTGDYFLRADLEVAVFRLRKKIVSLDEVVVRAGNPARTKTGIETSISRSTLQAMPTINRGFQDFVRMAPQAKTTGDGAISLAGQNNRFNVFFVDGADFTDIQGLAASGLNGGQTGSPPVSIEAIDELNVLQSPYHVQYGNFTGGSINAVSRSGTNQNRSAAWYYFRNENMAGKSPLPQEKPGSPGEYYHPRLPEFDNRMFGAWNSGALVKDKVFYFMLLEMQSELRPQPYNMAEYRGNSKRQQLEALDLFLKNTYRYDPGSFMATKDELKATRLNLKIDWNASARDKFMLSFLLNDAERTFQPTPAGSSTVRYAYNGIRLPAKTYNGSFEWKHHTGGRSYNRLLATFTNQQDDRQWTGQPFPYVIIFDGNGQLHFGSDAATGQYAFLANSFSLNDTYTWIREKHVLTTGADLAYAFLHNRYLSSYFGAYQFSSLSDFLRSARPLRLQHGYPLTAESGDETRLYTARNSFFFNDEHKAGANLDISYGLRLDMHAVLTTPMEDAFFNDSARPVIQGYYDLEGARSGETLKPQWTFSPRVSATYRIPRQKITLRAGAGVFAGHMINLWLSDIFNSINGSIDVANPPQFNPDPYGQPTAESLGLDPSNYKGTLNLVSRRFRYPSVFRTSLAAEKILAGNWKISLEGMYTHNIQEAVFRNVNILPPASASPPPDQRAIYSTNSMPEKIPLGYNGGNPYQQIILLSNNHDKKGYAYSVSAVISKQAGDFSLNGSYTFGRSWVLFEITGAQTPMPSQWRNMETINGRNQASLSTSDNDLRHRVAVWISQTIRYGTKTTATTLSLFYNGQTGNPFSYTNINSMVNDNGNRENFDLMYIPTNKELAEMHFVPNTINGISYTGEQQKVMLNNYIERNEYLRAHRGGFARRNGDRTPFTQVVDLRIQQHIQFRIRRERVGLILSYDVFNFTNMLNRKWGRIYTVPNDSYALVTFAGYANAATRTPAYRFTPPPGDPYSVQTSSVPGNSARWISQLGIKITIN